MVFADSGWRRSRAKSIASPKRLTSAAVFSRLFLSFATSTMTKKSCARRIAWLVLCLDWRQ